MLLLQSFAIIALLSTASAEAATIKFVEIEGAGTVAVTADDENGARVSFRFPGGREQRESELGEEFVPFDMGEDKELLTAASDFGQAGKQKILLRTRFPGGGGALYAFRFDGHRFIAEPSAGGEDFLQVDPNDPLEIDAAGLVRVKGRLTAKISDTKFLPKR
jgi:hypothetical protein